MAQTITVLGIDIAKLVFHVVGMDDSGHVVLRKRLARSALLTFIANGPPLRIGIEACGSAHDWARRFREYGHDVRVIVPQVVKPSVKSPKNDTRDAEAICEAVTRPTIRVMPIKRVEPQDLQALHRVRERLIKARTALVNEIRGLLSEYGMLHIFLPVSPSATWESSRVRAPIERRSAWPYLLATARGGLLDSVRSTRYTNASSSRLEVGCYTPQTPIPGSWRFAMAWCGLGEWHVGEAIPWLLAHGRLRQVGQYRQMALFLPG